MGLDDLDVDIVAHDRAAISSSLKHRLTPTLMFGA
jgi:hypothetical protein